MTRAHAKCSILCLARLDSKQTVVWLGVTPAAATTSELAVVRLGATTAAATTPGKTCPMQAPQLAQLPSCQVCNSKTLP